MLKFGNITAGSSPRDDYLGGKRFRPRNRRRRSRFLRMPDTASDVPSLLDQRRTRSEKSKSIQNREELLEGNEVEILIGRDPLLGGMQRLMQDYDGKWFLGCFGGVFSSSRRSKASVVRLPRLRW
jgi:hypothetical protein